MYVCLDVSHIINSPMYLGWSINRHFRSTVFSINRLLRLIFSPLIDIQSINRPALQRTYIIQATYMKLCTPSMIPNNVQPLEHCFEPLHRPVVMNLLCFSRGYNISRNQIITVVLILIIFTLVVQSRDY